jgi:hypothetical protein
MSGFCAQAHAQFKPPKLPNPFGGHSTPGLPDIKGWLNERLSTEPVKTSIKDSEGELLFLDEFQPSSFQPIYGVQRGNDGGIILPPGAYTLAFQSFCLHAGTHGPTNGDGYIYAPLKGSKAKIIREIVKNSANHPEISQLDVQLLLWTIEARVKYQIYDPRLKKAASTLLSPEGMAELNGWGVDALKDQAFDKASTAINNTLRPVFEAENSINGLVSQGNAAYADLERLAVLPGDPTPVKGDRAIPRSRWVLHKGGFLVRYSPSGYSRTQIYFYVPEQNQVVRDPQNRIVSVTNETGDRIETSYDDTIKPLESHNGKISGYAFASIKVYRQDRLVLQKDKAGWTLLGEVSQNAPAFAASDRYTDPQGCYQKAKELLKQVEDCQKPSHGKKATPADLTRLENITHYREGILSALTPDEATKAGVKELLDKAWVAFFLDGIGGSKKQSEVEETGNVNTASFVQNEKNAVDTAGINSMDGSSYPGYDSSDDVATPGETGRQRLKVGAPIKTVFAVLTYPDGTPVIDPNTNSPYPLPPGLNVVNNVGMAAALAEFDGDGFGIDIDLYMVNWFRHWGSEDYQRSSGVFQIQYRDVTNYNFGAVAAAAGYTLDESLYAAGLYNKVLGKPSGTDTKYGIRPDAVNNITQGWNEFLIWKGAR